MKIGKLKVIQAGVPFDRPDDYFAEMIKSDQHMFKVWPLLSSSAPVPLPSLFFSLFLLLVCFPLFSSYML